MRASDWLQLFVSGLAIGTVYGMLALGFVTIYRASRVVNFAQGDFAMLGGLFTVYLLKTVHLPYPLAGVLAVVITSTIGILIYQLVIAPLGRASLVSMLMVTIGASLFLQNGALIAWTSYPADLPSFSGDAPIRLGTIAILPQSLWIFLMAAVVVTALYLLTNHTLLGKAMTATATDPLAAAVVGVSTSSMMRLSFAISASVGALTGLFLAPMLTLNYASGAILGIKGLTALTLGGWGTATGAIVGGLALGVIETFGAGLLPAGYKDAIAFLILILILYFRPSGILGSAGSEELSLD
ncbi:MAG: branched-chain amino acid ABC transporter permease [Chloroflexi bacterium]|nr:branched-chain amino acid ABC transporter permease [Chloroflexota bacterium]